MCLRVYLSVEHTSSLIDLDRPFLYVTRGKINNPHCKDLNTSYIDEVRDLRVCVILQVRNHDYHTISVMLMLKII